MGLKLHSNIARTLHRTCFVSLKLTGLQDYFIGSMQMGKHGAENIEAFKMMNS